MPLFVYILKCRDNSFYTGVTNDIDRRFDEHNLGFDTRAYTYKRRPVELVFQEEFQDYNDAYVFEKQIKGWSRLKKEALIQGDYDKLQVLAKCKNKSVSQKRE